MKVIQKVISIISVIVIALAMMLFVQILFGIRPFVVMSGSMEPAIHTGSIVFADTGVTAADCSVGDIIIFSQGDNTVSHRIAEDRGEAFITKGDANEDADSNCLPKGAVDGKILYSIPYVGYIIVGLRSPAGIAAVLSFALLYLILTVLSDKIKIKEELTHAKKN